MCGIAGYSLNADSTLDRTFTAQALLAGIAERGADAVGYAYRSRGSVGVHKQRWGPSPLLDRLSVADDATQVLVHVRDYTKGHPTIEANNHPVRHGSVVGIHNGITTTSSSPPAASSATSRTCPSIPPPSSRWWSPRTARRRRSSSSAARWRPP